jgi:uncharacterized membrane protein
MIQPHHNRHLDQILATLLKLGTWLSCAIVALGLALPRLSNPMSVAHLNLVGMGIWLLIALPVSRVVLMGLWFMIHREVPFALAAAVVLGIIVLSALLGARIA